MFGIMKVPWFFFCAYFYPICYFLVSESAEIKIRPSLFMVKFSHLGNIFKSSNPILENNVVLLAAMLLTNESCCIISCGVINQ